MVDRQRRYLRCVSYWTRTMAKYHKKSLRTFFISFRWCLTSMHHKKCGWCETSTEARGHGWTMCHLFCHVRQGKQPTKPASTSIWWHNYKPMKRAPAHTHTPHSRKLTVDKKEIYVSVCVCAPSIYLSMAFCLEHNKIMFFLRGKKISLFRVPTAAKKSEEKVRPLSPYLSMLYLYEWVNVVQAFYFVYIFLCRLRFSSFIRNQFSELTFALDFGQPSFRVFFELNFSVSSSTKTMSTKTTTMTMKLIRVSSK